MTNSKAISVRIPDELLNKIDQLAREKYKSHKGTPNRSLVVLDAIVAYFNISPDANASETIGTVSDSVSTVDFIELQDSVYTLSDTVRQSQEQLILLSNSIRRLQEQVISLSVNVSQPDKPTQDNVIQPEPQLIIDTVSDSVNTVDSIELQDSETLTLSGQELAKRLKISPSRFAPERKKGLESFVTWTKSCKDNPDGAGWGFKGKSNAKGFIYYLVDESSVQEPLPSISTQPVSNLDA